MIKTVTDIEKLREVALDQHGYVTTEQAEKAGVTRNSAAALARRNRIERICYGVYRIPQVAETPYDEYELAVLWANAPEAALGFETALDAYDVCDVNPSKVHVVVRKGRRIKRAGGERFELHFQNVAPENIGWWHEIPIVKCACAIEQCILGGTPEYLLRQAIENAQVKRLITKDQASNLRKMLDDRTK